MVTYIEDETFRITKIKTHVSVHTARSMQTAARLYTKRLTVA